MAVPGLFARLIGAASLRGAKEVTPQMIGKKRQDATLSYTNMYDVMRELRKLDDEYAKTFRRNAREIAEPVQDSIQRGIRIAGTRQNPPLSGMRQIHFGRVAWGSTWAGMGSSSKPKRADSATIEVPPPKRKSRRGRTSIVRVKVGSPGTVLADMAGSSNKYTQAFPITRNYDYMYTIKGQKVQGIRRHRITTQGLIFINKMGGSGRRSFVWVAAEKALPGARQELDKLITKVNTIVNVRMRARRAR